MGTEKGIVQQRKKNEVTNKKVFERDFTLQKKTCESTSMALWQF